MKLKILRDGISSFCLFYMHILSEMLPQLSKNIIFLLSVYKTSLCNVILHRATFVLAIQLGGCGDGSSSFSMVEL